MIIIMVGGKQHGKDTFTEILTKMHPELNFKRRAFADAMKGLTGDLLQCSPSSLESLKVQEDVSIINTELLELDNGVTMRTFLQTLGQSLKDLTGNPLIWCDILAQTMQVEKENYIISDCRFGFEAKYLRTLAYQAKQKVAVVKITNPRVVMNEDTHVSEQSYQDIITDFAVINGGTIEELQEVAVNLVKEIEEI